MEDDEFLYDDPDEFSDDDLPPAYWSVQIPSEIRPGTWWDWGWFDTPGEAVEALREAGIPVDDHGNLQLLQEEG